jgi:PAS domain S-box-containing protein
MAFDVSARARFERELLASEARCRATAEHLRAAIDAGALGLWEFEAATQIFTLDARMAAMLGLPADETRLTRPDLRAFIDPADRAHAASAFDEAGKTAGLYADEVRIRTVQGETRWLISRGAALPERGRIVGVVSDITGRHQREESLEAALRANDVLMREADHRIKNSLQLVAAVLHLQMNRLRDADARGALAEAIGRVDAVANAHLALQNSPDLKTIDVGRMLLNMCERMGKLNPSVAVRCEPEPDIALDAERAIPLGMIASELLTNALRHAYPPGVQGEVQVTASAEHEVLAITITDGGAGMSPSSVKPGLGSTVVATLARKLGAEIATDAPSGGGTSVTLRLRLADLGAGI